MNFSQLGLLSLLAGQMPSNNFPSEIYKQRVIIESIFSAIKRRFGHQIYARRFSTQKNELMFRIIAYDVERLVNLCVKEVYFLLSPIGRKT